MGFCVRFQEVFGLDSMAFAVLKLVCVMVGHGWGLVVKQG